MDFKNKLDIVISEYNFYSKKSFKYSLYRLYVFIVFLISIFTYFINPLFVILIISSFISFLYVVFLHNKIDIEKTILKNKIEVIKDYISRVDGTYPKRLKSTGLEFNTSDFLQDLDILGNGSLFTYLNVCQTYGGKRKLYLSLLNEFITELPSKQESIIELKEEVDFAIDFQAKAKTIDNDISSFNENLIDKNKLLINLSFGLLITILISIFFILNILKVIKFYYVLIMIFTQVINTFYFLKKYKKSMFSISITLNSCNNLNEFFNILKNKSFKSKLLEKIIQTITNSSVGIKKISTLASFDEIRKNGLLLLLFNSIFPFTILIIYLYNKNIQKYQDVIQKGISSYEDFEALLSLSVIGVVKKNVCMPNRVNHLEIKFKGIMHPLLKEESCIQNDFETKEGVNIITGSNMSGKTSFMRMIGINLVLMNAGTFVHADSFSAPYLKLFTSMRIVDDIKEGVSSFYRELLKIKNAIEYQKTNNFMIVLIDEVFRGTNSNDRIQGAISLIKKLNNNKTIVIITTHDFELCDIPIQGLKNYHFSEYYENEEIHFPYKIQNGKCKTTNALYLMKLAGITE